MAEAMTEKDYSGTPLYKKLGIKEGSAVGLTNEPDDFLDTLGTLPDGVEVLDRASRLLDVIVLFSRTNAHLGRRFPAMKKLLAPDGGLWVAYPKRDSEYFKELTFSDVQELGLTEGLVDNKSCAIDGDWSAVRFVYRKEDREKL